MDRYSFEVRHWLDLRYDEERLARIGIPYAPYQPLDGIPDGAWSNGTVCMAARMARLCADLEALGARSLLDVGGAEGLVADVARRVTGVEAVSSDLSLAASQRAARELGVPALACEAHRLPFADGAFDVVYCGEVVEHLARPVEALLELARVARLAIVVTSEEALFDAGERARELDERTLAEHMDRSLLIPDDLPLVLPDLAWARTNQLTAEPVPAPTERAQVRARLADWLDVPPESFDGFGLYAVGRHRGPAAAAAGSSALDPVLEALAPRTRLPVAPGDGLPDALVQRLRCPACGEALDLLGEPACAACGRTFARGGAVPDLCLARGDDPGPTLADRLADRDEGAREAVCDLARRFELPLPEPLAGGPLPLEAARWTAGPDTLIRDDANGLWIEATGEDPWVVSPRLALPLARLARLRLRLEVLEPGAGDLQVYFKTLHWPLFWEGASVRVELPTEPGPQTLELPASDRSFFAPDDELLELRIDPSDGASRVRLEAVELLA